MYKFVLRLLLICLFVIGALNPKFSSADTAFVQDKNLAIDELWNDARRSILAGEQQSASQKILDLQDLKVSSGYSHLPEISNELAIFSNKYKNLGDKEQAVFFMRKALEISPNDIGLMIEYAGLITEIGLLSSTQLLKKIILSAFDRYDLIFHAMLQSFYPILWALTFAAIICVFLFMLSNVQVMFSKLGQILRSKPQANLISMLTIACLMVMPLLSGPIWTLVVYTTFLYYFFPAQRVFAAFCSLLLILWVVLVPLKENWQLWADDAGNLAVLRIASKTFSENDLSNLQSLLRNRPFDGSVLLAYGKVLRRQGMYEESEKILHTARNFVSAKEVVDQELLITYFLKGEGEKAAKLSADLEKQGLNSAEFLFNYSKINFDMLDTEGSRSLFDRANSKNKPLMQDMRMLEDKLGFKHRLAFAESRMPLTGLLSSALIPNQAARERSDIKFQSVIKPAMDPIWIVGLGTLLFSFYLITAKPRRKDQLIDGIKGMDSFSKILCLFPGGNALASGATMRAFCSICFIIILALPLMGWPQEANLALRKMSGLELYYTFAFCFIFAAFCYVSFSAGKERN